VFVKAYHYRDQSLTEKQKSSLLGILFSGLAGLATGFSMLGATQAYIPTLFFAGLSCGASLIAFRKNVLDQREQK
jgi:hypothetical protein